MVDDHGATETGESVRTLPVVLHSFLSDKNSCTPISPLHANCEQAAWRKLFEVCGGGEQKPTGDPGHPLPPDFASKAEEFLRIALGDDAGGVTLGSAYSKHCSSLAGVIHMWRPTRGEYEEEENTLLNEHVRKKDGYLCGNKSAIRIIPGDGLLARSDHTSATSSSSPLRRWMTATVAEYAKWHSKRVSLLRPRILAAEKCRGKALVKDESPSTQVDDTVQVVRVGQLGSAEGHAFSFSSMVFFDDFSRSSLQMLSAEETLSCQCAALSSAAAKKEDSILSCDGDDTKDVVKDEKTSLGDKAPSAINVSRNSAEEMCLYPGQVVAVRGLVVEDEFGVKFLVSSIRGGPPLPPPRYLSQPLLPPLARENLSDANTDLPQISVEDMYLGDPVHIIVASAQMIGNKGSHPKVRQLELELLLSRVREHAPHILILFGPIVPSSIVNETDMSDPDAFDSLPDVRLLYRDFFRLLSHRLSGVRTKVFVIPSTADVAHATPLLPQPPYPAQFYTKRFSRPPQQPQQIHFLPNPATLRVNELDLLLTSADPLMEIGSELCYTRNCCTSRQELIAVCCESLLRQRTLFPAGTCGGTPVEPNLFSPLMFDARTPPLPSSSSSSSSSSSGTTTTTDMCSSGESYDINTSNVADSTAKSSSDSIMSGSPHIIIFPSDANFSPSVKSGGAFACHVSGRLIVIPYSPRNAEASSDRTEWTSVYIHPPTRKQHGFSGGSGVKEEADEGDDELHSSSGDANARNSTHEKTGWRPIELEKRVTVRHASYFVH